MDPFPPTCDPAAYVPRAATDRVIDALLAGFHTGKRVMTLSGPGGLGKTMILRVLEDRLAGEARCLHLPYAALETDDLVSWVAGLLGREATSDDSREELEAIAKDGPPLALLLDDASALPPETARDLVAWVGALGGALRLVVVPVDDDRAGRVLAALGDDVVDLRLREPMSEAETRSYVAARLAASSAPDETVRRLSDGRIGWLHRESAGNPRVLHGLVTWLLYSDSPAPGTFKADEDHRLDTDVDAELEPEAAGPAATVRKADASCPDARPPAGPVESGREAYLRRRRRRRS